METTDRQATRERLVDAAMALFRRDGYEGTAVSGILQRAEAKSGSLYYFFPRKLDLLLAVLERYRELLHPLVMKPAMDRCDDPLDCVFAVLDGYRSMLLESGFKAGCPVGSIGQEMAGKSDDVSMLVAANFRDWQSAIHGCLDRAARRFPDDINREDVASFILTTMEGAVLQAQVHRSIEPFDASVRMLEEFMHRILNGSRKAKGA